MSALLDKEMPQQQPKRPVAFWLVLTACMTGLGVWLFWPNRHPAVDPLQPAQVPAAHTAVTTKDAQKTASAASNPLPASNTAPTSIQALDVQIQQPRLQWPGRSFTLPHIAPNSNDHTPEAAGQSIQDVERNLLKYTPVFFWQENSPEQAAITPEAQPALAALPQAIPVLAHHQPMPTAERISTGAPKRIKQFSPVLSFGLLTGTSAFQVRKTPGIHAGINCNIDFARQRFGVQTGLVYRYQRYNKAARPVLPVTYKAYLDATGNEDIGLSQAPNSLLYLANTNRIILPITESHQLEIPALTYLRLGSRWRFYAGMTFLRHVWVESSPVGLFTYNLKVVTTPDDSDAQGNLNNVITGQLPRWEKNWQTGLSFQPMKRLEVGIYYRSVWRGMPVLSDFHKLFDTCNTCDAQYPKARENTLSAIRPQAFQFNLYYKF